MIRVSRAGRKSQVYTVLRFHYFKVGNWGLTTGEIARRIGMKSSTNLKNILREMTKEYPEISIEKRNGFDVFIYRPYVQQPIQFRTILINGLQCYA